MKVVLLLALLLPSCASAPTTFVDSMAHVQTIEADDSKANHKPVMIEVGDISAEELAPVMKAVYRHVQHGDKTINLRINSNGGGIFAGLEFIQQIEELHKVGVHFRCIVDHRAISMGFVILQAACDERLATPRAFFLAHNGAIGQTGGTKEDLQENVDILSVLNDSLSQICAERIGMPVAEYRRRLKDKKSWTFGSEEALKFNVIDGLINPLDTPQLDTGE